MTQHQRVPTVTAYYEVEVPVLIAAKRYADSRGWFTETYSDRTFAARGITCGFVQDNHSMSAQKGTIRGLHFQLPPMAQAKLVRVTRGRILDVAVDIRRGSPTFGKFVSAELSAENGHQLFVPVGFAHGFCTLEDDTEVSYKVSEFYSPKHDAGIRWDDPTIAVSWPVGSGDVVVSDKDAKQSLLSQWESSFVYSGEPLTGLRIEG
jgi:dTDP-4-dehydrorhamnose 3,5-epimerase